MPSKVKIFFNHQEILESIGCLGFLVGFLPRVGLVSPFIRNYLANQYTFSYGMGIQIQDLHMETLQYAFCISGGCHFF
jgi:hypothetical protein